MSDHAAVQLEELSISQSASGESIGAPSSSIKSTHSEDTEDLKHRVHCLAGILGFTVLLCLLTLILLITNMTKDVNTDDAVILSSSPVSPEGFRFGGNLFAGEGEWVTKEQMPFPLSDLASVEIDGYTYIAGGLTSDFTPSDATFSFNPVLEEFNTNLSSAPRGRFRHHMAAVGRVIFAIGGKDDFETDQSVLAVDMYDVDSDTWSTPVDMPETRSDCAVAAYESKIYVFGGYAEDYSLPEKVLELDTETFTWSEKASFPDTRGDIGAVTMGELIYIVGGWGPPWTEPSNLVHMYDPMADKFTQLNSMKYGRGDAAVVPLTPTSFLVVGGEQESNIEYVNEVPLHSVEEYHIDTDLWVERAPLGYARFRFTGTGGENGVHIFGGHINNGATVALVDSFYFLQRETNVYYHLADEL